LIDQIKSPRFTIKLCGLEKKLEIKVPFLFQGDLKLKCTATIASIYWKSNEESVQGVRPQSALVSESRSSRNPGKIFLILKNIFLFT